MKLEQIIYERYTKNITPLVWVCSSNVITLTKCSFCTNLGISL